MGEEMLPLSLQEALTMQLDEMELLETAYPEVTFDTPDARPVLRAVLDQLGQQDENAQQWLQAAMADAPLLSFRCALPHREAQLRVRLPRRYPDGCPLVVTVLGTPQLKASARRAIADAAEGEANRLSAEPRSEPQCLQVLGEASRAAADVADAESAAGGGVPPAATAAAAAAAAAPSTTAAAVLIEEEAPEAGVEGSRGRGGGGDDSGKTSRSTNASGAGLARAGAEPAQGVIAPMGRRLIYSHHIIATQKRTGIVKAAREFNLGGFSKVGWPGVIVVEGEEASCESFVQELRRWRWKHLAVRGEERAQLPKGRTLDQERLLPLPLEELGEKEGVSGLARRCREAGLGELFSTLLR